MKIRVFESLSEIPPSVRRRFSYPSQPNFFLSLNWFSCLFETALKDDLQARIYALEDDAQEIVGLQFCGVRKGERVR